jgi:hypothetical protein
LEWIHFRKPNIAQRTLYGAAYDPQYWSDLAVSVQSGFAQRNYYHGAMDGEIGSGSRQAIRAFQAAQGLPVTGTIDPKLLKTLESNTGLHSHKRLLSPTSASSDRGLGAAARNALRTGIENDRVINLLFIGTGYPVFGVNSSGSRQRFLGSTRCKILFQGLLVTSAIPATAFEWHSFGENCANENRATSIPSLFQRSAILGWIYVPNASSNRRLSLASANAPIASPYLAA